MNLDYLSGFGNEHSSEALPGALPVGQFSPQKCAYGLYTEQISTTAFTAPRATNRRSWMYRIQPSVCRGDFQSFNHALIKTAPIEGAVPYNPLRWDPIPVTALDHDFIDGLITVAANGDARTQTGIGIHYYVANRDMEKRFFYSADGELLFIPQQGSIRLSTEMGLLDISPGEIAVIPRGITFKVTPTDGPVRGYVCENYGSPFQLPERGLVGANGYANDRDFLYPVARYEDIADNHKIIAKFCGQLFEADLDHSPLNVVAWTGNSSPYKYDLARFNVMGSISYDHPDPSIYTVLTSVSDTPGIANADFVIFPPRWIVADNTFRPPWYHRNIMSEFMGLIRGQYDAKKHGFEPGGMSLHNCMIPHGPDAQVFEQASEAVLTPQHMTESLAFMLESRYPIIPTQYALNSTLLQTDYSKCWDGLPKQFDPG